MKNIVIRLLRDERGASALEYGLVASLIAVIIITGVTAVGTRLSAVFTNISTAF